MIKILNANFNLQAVIDNVESNELKEEINREFYFNFTTIEDNILVEKDVKTMDIKDSRFNNLNFNREHREAESSEQFESKSQFLQIGNIVEVDGQYFDINYISTTRDSDGTVLINVESEHISYRLNSKEFNKEFFTKEDTPQNILEEILKDTGLDAGVAAAEDSNKLRIFTDSAVIGELSINQFISGGFDYDLEDIDGTQQNYMLTVKSSTTEETTIEWEYNTPDGFQQDTTDNIPANSTPEQIIQEIIQQGITNWETEDQGEVLFSIEEETSRRSLLVNFAEAIDGELLYDGTEVSIVSQRGSDFPTSFLYSKNITSSERIIDNREGDMKISYDVTVQELSEADGYSELEKITLGDEVNVIDQEIGIE